ncbi:MAG: ABC transporter permease [Verrucomicrobiota bacterium]
MNLRQIFIELFSRPLGIASASVLGLLYFSAIFAGFLATQATNEQDLERTYHPPTKIFFKEGGLRVQAYQLVDPSTAAYEPVEGKSYPLQIFGRGFEYRLFGLIPTDRHLLTLADEAGSFYLLGSDSTGRDVFSRLLYGAQVSLFIGLIGITITTTLGFLVGGLSGYFAGRTDFVVMRLVEFLMAIPGLYLLLSLRAALAPYFESDQMFFVIVIILAFIGWAGTARILRGMTLSIRKHQYVAAAESMGQHPLRILQKHVLPNLVSYLLVAATLSIPGYVLGEAALSFLGLGIQEPAASWGLMLSQAQDVKVFYLNFWWMLAPGFAIFVTVIAYNVLGDVLRDIVDPNMQTR